MQQTLTYDTLERISPPRPVDRLGYIAEACRGKRVLDIGCYDETALVKRDTEHWLHGRIAAVAASVVGIDSSDRIPKDGLVTGERSIILHGDGFDPRSERIVDETIDVIVAGEFIEHIAPPIDFFRNMKRRFPGRELIVSTPNGVTFANTLLGALGREVQHPDHVQVFTYKILNTLCARAGFTRWQILPYRFYATEMILNSSGPKQAAARATQGVIRVVERMFPLLSFGYIVRIGL
jgi:SAM-dependent methyltransferase